LRGAHQCKTGAITSRLIILAFITEGEAKPRARSRRRYKPSDAWPCKKPSKQRWPDRHQRRQHCG
jgi:hypothetical protein